MALCRICGYDADAAEKDGVKKTFADKLIQLRSRLTHTEFQFSSRYNNISFSFTMADGVNGARFKNIRYSHPNRWLFANIPLDNEQEDIAFLAACVLAGFSLNFQTVKNWLHSEMILLNLPVCLYSDKHWKYDLIGLLSFADEEPYKGKDSKLLKVIRPVLWSWTKIVQPHSKRAWCSEGCAILLQECEDAFKYKPDTLTPDGLIQAVREMYK